MVRQDTPPSYSPALTLRKNNSLIPFAPRINAFQLPYLCLYGAAAVCYVGVGEENPDLYEGFNKDIMTFMKGKCFAGLLYYTTLV